jgi:hypothetical protein
MRRPEIARAITSLSKRLYIIRRRRRPTSTKYMPLNITATAQLLALLVLEPVTGNDADDFTSLSPNEAFTVGDATTNE